jgi:hypothetical protein
MNKNHNLLQDIDGRKIEQGHILAVRYVWNSYAGEVTMKGLYVGGRYHDLDDKAHYQIIGHTNKDHEDYRKDVYDWLQKYYSGKKHPECPVKIRVYDNMEKVAK